MSDHTILCLTDFGRAGDDALQQAATEARARAARLHVLHVVDCDGESNETDELCPKQQTESDLQVLTRSLDCDDVSVEVLTGDPIEETIQAIQRLNPKLVVLGTHQTSSSDSPPTWILSEYVKAVISRSECPALICRGPAKITDVSGMTSQTVSGIDNSQSGTS